MTDALRELARYDAMRQRSRELHEEHRQAVLSGSGRQHHDEATDSLVVEALHALIYAAEAGHQGGKIGCECFWCSAVRKGRRALKVLGK